MLISILQFKFINEIKSSADIKLIPMIDQLISIYTNLWKEELHELEGVETIDDPFWSTLFKIELLVSTHQIKNAETVWNNKFQLFDSFIADVVRMKIAIQQFDYNLAMDIQTKWQIILDKFDRDPVNMFYLGMFFQNLGVLYHSKKEFEIAVNNFIKADSYFKKVEFGYAQYLVQENIAISYQDLGAYGDAKYHLREALRRDYIPISSEIYQNRISQGDVYLKINHTNKAEEAYLEAYELREQIDEIDQLVIYHKLYDLYSLIGNKTEAEKYKEKGRKLYQRYRANNSKSNLG